ncbi:MAG: hypothetical protein LBB56_05105 [Chitinispirillales bacterium]|jgi:formate dehydrogenase maturation protein FdhE|nr:hypothetical protein [Chitinispirillales bacterium]
MSNLKEIEEEAKKTTKKILEQINKINNSQFESIIAELKKNGVDAAAVKELEAVINDAAQRNKRLAELIKKSKKVGDIITRTICPPI